jgi:hypothetical protein
MIRCHLKSDGLSVSVPCDMAAVYRLSDDHGTLYSISLAASSMEVQAISAALADGSLVMSWDVRDSLLAEQPDEYRGARRSSDGSVTSVLPPVALNSAKRSSPTTPGIWSPSARTKSSCCTRPTRPSGKCCGATNTRRRCSDPGCRRFVKPLSTTSCSRAATFSAGLLIRLSPPTCS